MNGTAWDGLPPDPTRDGWYWVATQSGRQIARWSAATAKWKRIGRQQPLPPAVVAREWSFVAECEMPALAG